MNLNRPKDCHIHVQVYKQTSISWIIGLIPHLGIIILCTFRSYMVVVGRKESWKMISKMPSSHVNDEDENKICSNEGTGKRLWKRVRYQLVEYHSLPEFLKDNEFILGYYRSEWPLKQILLSIFYIHNETLNVWTHLIGFVIFLFLTIYTAMEAPKAMGSSFQHLSNMLRRTDLQKFQQELLTCLPSMPNMADFRRFADELRTSLPPMEILSSLSGWHVFEIFRNCLPTRYSVPNQSNVFMQGVEEEEMMNSSGVLMIQPITRWPFFAFMGGAMFCLLASCTCHLLSCHSKRVAYIMLRLDYAGIAALISTSFYPPVYYSFMCNPFFCYLYLSTITILGGATIIFSLSPVFDKPQLRSFRASLFFGMGVSGVAPIIHKLILYRNQPEAIQTTGYEVLMGVFYGIGALIYALRVPERWKPGKFDIAGQSHQLFHILVVAGAYTHYHTGLIYLRWRDATGC